MFGFFCFFAVCIETTHFQEVIPHLTKKTLLVLDIDDTLLVPPQMLGSDIWFLHRVSELKASDMPADLAFERALFEWEAIRQLTEMEIVEQGTEQILRQLQDDGYTVMGLTTQRFALAPRTLHHLQKNQIYLHRTAPSQDECYFLNKNHGLLYRGGILFTDGSHKGLALFNLLKQIDFYPEKVVFLNDKATHLAEIEETSAQLGVEFVGLRYGYSDARKQAFRADVANHQFEHSNLHHLISDTEALKILSLP